MKSINLLLLVFFLACSKPGVSSEQNVKKVQSTFNIYPESVKLVSDCNTEQSIRIKEHIADDPIDPYDLICFWQMEDKKILLVGIRLII